jgi:hypothetical protein
VTERSNGNKDKRERVPIKEIWQRVSWRGYEGWGRCGENPYSWEFVLVPTESFESDTVRIEYVESDYGDPYYQVQYKLKGYEIHKLQVVPSVLFNYRSRHGGVSMSSIGIAAKGEMERKFKNENTEYIDEGMTYL